MTVEDSNTALRIYEDKKSATGNIVKVIGIVRNGLESPNIPFGQS
jgi:hypothetical protein